MVSNYKTEFNNKAIEEQLGEYSLKLDTPRIDAETTMDYFQRLSIVAFYEPLRMEPYKDIRFATWAGWATKFFAHGSIAYLLYLDRTLATHSPAPDSPRSDIHVAQAPSPPSYRMPYPGRDTLPVPETSATYRATCQLVPIDPPTLSSVIGTCGVGPHESNAGTSRDETIRQLNIQNSVLQKQFKSLFTPSLHVALDRVRINSRGVPLSKYPLSERIRDTLAIATLPIGYYDYVLLQLMELTVFRRHTWQRQGYLATAADVPSITSSIYLDDQDFSLHSPGPGSPVPGPEKSLPPVPEIPIMSATNRATCQLAPINPPTLSSVIGTCGVGPHESHATTSSDAPAVGVLDPTYTRTPMQYEGKARIPILSESTPAPTVGHHPHKHEEKPCRVSIPSTVKDESDNKKYFYSCSMRVSNPEYPCHVGCQASPAQPFTSSTHFSCSRQILRQNDFLAEPLVKKVTGNVCRPDPQPIQVSMSACPGLLSAPSTGTAGLFTSRAKHRWTVLDQPTLGFVSDHWQRSVKRSGPPALHSQVDLGLYRPRHRTYRTGKRHFFFIVSFYLITSTVATCAMSKG